MRGAPRAPAALLLAALALATAGCGREDDASAPPPAGTTPPAASTPSTPPPNASDQATAEPAPAPLTLAEPVEATGAQVEQLALHNAQALIATPRHRDELRTGVVFTHGYGEPHTDIVERTPLASLGAALLKAGASIGASAARGPAWGTPESVNDYRAVAEELRRRGARRIVVLASSMGGVAGLQLMDEAEAFAGIYPVCDLQAMTEEGRFERAVVLDGWRGRQLPQRLSPVRLTRSQILGKPMVFWASPQDTLVTKTRQTDRCAAAYEAAGARVRVNIATGNHGNGSHFDPPAVVTALMG